MKLRLFFLFALLAGINVACAAESADKKGCRNDPDFLAAFGEPTLTARGKGPDYFAIRLVYLPTFRHPILVRYEEDGRKRVRRAVVLSGKAGYDLGEIAFQHTDEASGTEIADIKKGLERARYWDLTSSDATFGADGDTLTVEVIRNGQCKAISRWEPEHKATARGLVPLVDLYVGLFERAAIWRDVAPMAFGKDDYVPRR
ncbi:hypothetical protein ISN76_18980 [Dyella halodurans]|uniref:Chalcone isomerase domain-containing protein n=1 Tax=Dyella halodurans TaxID=1920171 RepID=A0ABV9C026_9GAMM|nr:hypothetical protein [Dyella halodurans]